MEVAGAKVLAHRLQDATDDEEVVEHREEHEQPVEDAGHLRGAEDRDGDAVDDQAGQADQQLGYALQPPRQLGVELQLLGQGGVAAGLPEAAVDGGRVVRGVVGQG